MKLVCKVPLTFAGDGNGLHSLLLHHRQAELSRLLLAGDVKVGSPVTYRLALYIYHVAQTDFSSVTLRLILKR